MFLSIVFGKRRLVFFFIFNVSKKRKRSRAMPNMGREHLELMLRGATQFQPEGPFRSASRPEHACDFGQGGLIRPLRGCPSRRCGQGLSAAAPSLWAKLPPVLLPHPRVIKIILPHGPLGAHHLAPVQITPLQTQDQHLRRSEVRPAGDVVLVAVAQRLDHLLVRPTGRGCLGR